MIGDFMHLLKAPLPIFDTFEEMGTDLWFERSENAYRSMTPMVGTRGSEAL